MRINQSRIPLDRLKGEGKLYDVEEKFLCNTKYLLDGTIHTKTTRGDNGKVETVKHLWRDGSLTPEKWNILKDLKEVILELDDGRHINLKVTDARNMSVKIDPALF